MQLSGLLSFIPGLPQSSYPSFFPLLPTGCSKKGVFAEASFENLVPTSFCFEPKWANE